MRETSELDLKIVSILEDRKIPQEIVTIISKAYREYKEFCSENMKEELKESSLANVKEYADGNYTALIRQISNQYESDCENKMTNLLNITSRLIKDDTTNQEAEYRVEDAVLDKGKNYGRIDKITGYFLDSLTDSRNRLLRVLDSLDTPEKRIDYVFEQVELIKVKTRMRLGKEGKEILDIDDNKIVNKVLEEYEKYKEENREVKTEENKEESAVKEFKEKYEVSEEELKPIEHKENSGDRPKQEKSLPGNVIE